MASSQRRSRRSPLCAPTAIRVRPSTAPHASDSAQDDTGKAIFAGLIFALRGASTLRPRCARRRGRATARRFLVGRARAILALRCVCDGEEIANASVFRRCRDALEHAACASWIEAVVLVVDPEIDVGFGQVRTDDRRAHVIVDGCPSNRRGGRRGIRSSRALRAVRARTNARERDTALQRRRCRPEGSAPRLFVHV